MGGYTCNFFLLSTYWLSWTGEWTKAHWDKSPLGQKPTGQKPTGQKPTAKYGREDKSPLLNMAGRTKAGLILAQNDHGPLKWANGPYPIQIHANFQILMGHLKFLWALCKIWWAQESLISILEHNWHEIWIACIRGPAKNKVHFSKTLIVFSQNGVGPS